MSKFRITVQRVIKEEYDMELEAENLVSALDQAREMVRVRNERINDEQYSVTRIEDVKEST